MARVRKKSRGLETTYLKHLLYEGLSYGVGGISIYLAIEYNWLLLIVVPFVLSFAFFVRRRRVVISGGLKGERNSKKVFKELDKNYSVLQSIPLMVDGKKGEIDFLIIGKSNIFLVETKNLNGKIYGNPLDNKLVKDKYVNGKLIRDRIGNPAKQIERTVRLLRRQMEPHHFKIVPLILSIHPKAEWVISFSDLPVLDDATIVSFIEKYERKESFNKDFQKRVEAALK